MAARDTKGSILEAMVRNGETNLKALAKAAATQARAPFSNFRVGAAVKTTAGKAYTGCNIENSSFGSTACAEQVAIYKAYSEGERDFAEMAVFALGEKLPYPCGKCRQVLWELGGDFKITVCSEKGTKEHFLKDLIPYPFSL